MTRTARGALAGLSFGIGVLTGAFPAAAGSDVVGDADLDPWIFSAGLGYRFNLGSIFGHSAEAAPIK